MAIVTVNVTQEDKDNGIPGECARCPVAIAMERAGFDGAQVDAITLNWWTPAGRVYVNCPDEVAQFVEAYDEVDSRGNARPLSFDIDTDRAEWAGEGEPITLVAVYGEQAFSEKGDIE